MGAAYVRRQSRWLIGRGRPVQDIRSCPFGARFACTRLAPTQRGHARLRPLAIQAEFSLAF